MYSILQGEDLPSSIIDTVRRQEGKRAKTGYAMIILDGLMAYPVFARFPSCLLTVSMIELGRSSPCRIEYIVIRNE